MYIYERDLEHPVPTSALSEEEVTEGEPVQLSVAAAVPAVGNDEGLHPSADPEGQKVNVGADVLTI